MHATTRDGSLRWRGPLGSARPAAARVDSIAAVTSRVRIVDRTLLGTVGFTDHAIERFAERAGLDVAGRAGVEPIARDLLMQEGRAVATPPSWYRSSNGADGYLQAGEWMLFICRTSRRRAGAFDVVTVVSNGDRTPWPKARRRGLILTPPPLGPKPRRRPPRVGWLRSVAAGLRLRRSGEVPIGRFAAVLRARRELRAAAAAAHAADRGGFDAARARYEQERRDAHERHVRMWGGRG